MNHKLQGSSEAVSKEAFLATLKRFVEHFGPTELVITQTRTTESRYQWLAELKSKLSSSFASKKLSSVEYAYTISGNQFLFETDEQRDRVLAVRIHPRHTTKDMSAWLATELRKLGVLVVRRNRKDLVHVTELCQAGKLVPMIDRSYPLSDVPEALQQLGEGHVKGKVVISVDGR